MVLEQLITKRRRTHRVHRLLHNPQLPLLLHHPHFLSILKPDAPATTATTDADAAKSLSNSGFKFAAGVNPPSQTTSNKPPSIFNFGAASQPSATPVFAGFGQPPQPANTSGGAFGGKSSFGQGTNNAFGNTGGIFGNKTAATPGGNVFGGMNNQSSTSTPATTNVLAAQLLVLQQQMYLEAVQPHLHSTLVEQLPLLQLLLLLL